MMLSLLPQVLLSFSLTLLGLTLLYFAVCAFLAATQHRPLDSASTSIAPDEVEADRRAIREYRVEIWGDLR